MRWAGAIDGAASEPPVALVTIYTAGGVLRASSVPVAVEDADTGETYHYPGGLLDAVDVEGSLDLLRMEGGHSLRQARLGLVLPEGEDAAALDGGWWALAAARVEVALWWEGMRWQDRDVLIRGPVSGALTLGIEGQPSRFTVEAWEPASAWAVSPDRDIGADGFPASLGFGTLTGYSWPTIIGRVYGIPAIKGGIDSGSTYWALLCGHHFAPSVTVADFEVYGADTAIAPTALSVDNGSAPSGDYGALQATSDFLADDPKLFVDCAGGGVANPRRADKAATGADGVLEYLLHTSGVPVDWHRMAETLALLRGWEIGLYLDDPASCLDVIRQAVAEFLPIVEMQGPDGLWYAYVEPWTAPIRAHLTHGQELTGRVGALTTTDPSECRNSFVLQYAFDHYIDDFRSRVALDASNYELCRYSQQLFGVRAEAAIKCPITWDATTARRMVQHMAARRALPRRRLTYTADPSLYWLEEGMWIELTDPLYGLSRARAYLRSVTRAARPIALDVEVFDCPPASSVLG